MQKNRSIAHFFRISFTSAPIMFLFYVDIGAVEIILRRIWLRTFDTAASVDQSAAGELSSVLETWMSAECGQRWPASVLFVQRFGVASGLELLSFPDNGLSLGSMPVSSHQSTNQSINNSYTWRHSVYNSKRRHVGGMLCYSNVVKMLCVELHSSQNARSSNNLGTRMVRFPHLTQFCSQ